MLGFLCCRTRTRKISLLINRSSERDKNLWVKAGSQKKSPEGGLFKLPNQDSNPDRQNQNL